MNETEAKLPEREVAECRAATRKDRPPPGSVSIEGHHHSRIKNIGAEQAGAKKKR